MSEYFQNSVNIYEVYVYILYICNSNFQYIYIRIPDNFEVPEILTACDDSSDESDLQITTITIHRNVNEVASHVWPSSFEQTIVDFIPLFH